MPKFYQNFLFIFLILLGQVSYLQAGIAVHPNRVQFDKYSPKSQEIILNNRSHKKQSYRVKFIHLRMNKNGKYKRITAKQAIKGERFADRFIRYSPKRVVLQAKETQVIRLMLRRGKNLKDGEYRSHILVQEEAPQSSGRTITKKIKGKNLSITLKPLFGISLPVIVKHGKLFHQVKINNIKLKKNKKAKKTLEFDINRTGNESVYGEVIVSFDPKGFSREKEIARQSSVAVFFPYKKRRMKMQLKIPKRMHGKTGILKIQYKVKDNSHKKELYTSLSKEIKL